MPNVARERKCNSCGRAFSGPSDVKYCSDECRDDKFHEYKNCKKCDKEYYGHISSSYCSTRCRLRYNWNTKYRNRNVDLNKTIKCLYCGKEFQTNQPQKFCSKECRLDYKADKKHKSRLKTKICLFCYRQFETPWSNKTYCSDDCLHKDHQAVQNSERKMALEHTKEQKKCIICQNLFFPHNGGQLCCSKECSKVRYKIKNDEWQKRYRYASRSKVGKEINCKYCNRPFIITGIGQKFCSPDHLTAWHQKNDDRYLKIRGRFQKYKLIKLYQPFIAASINC